jgi:hypothetical protein
MCQYMYIFITKAVTVDIYRQVVCRGDALYFYILLPIIIIMLLSNNKVEILIVQLVSYLLPAGFRVIQFHNYS